MHTASSKPRIQFVDLAKGVCICLVVLFHAQVLPESTPLLGALRMPLYFFLSGLFFKTYGGLGALALKKANRILMPFVFFYFVGEVAFIAIINIFGESVAQTYHYNLLRPLFEMAPHNYPLWFLVSLFWCNLLFCMLRQLLRSDAAVGVAVMLCAFAGIALSMNSVESAGWTAPALTGLPFFYFGYMARRSAWMYPGHHDRLSLPVGLALTGIAAVLCVAGGNSFLSMAHNRVHGSALMAYATSLAVVPGVLMLCKAAGHLPWLSYVGRYSVVVLCTHMVVMSPIRVLLRDGDPAVCNIVSGFGALLLCTLLIRPLTRYLPAFTAQSDALRVPQRVSGWLSAKKKRQMAPANEKN